MAGELHSSAAIALGDGRPDDLENAPVASVANRRNHRRDCRHLVPLATHHCIAELDINTLTAPLKREVSRCQAKIIAPCAT